MAEPAPYRRIVAEIRADIVAGRLAPGDRVPSTREITRRWGVAMATATKALAALRADGLVVVRPGVGTVVAGARSVPSGVRRRETPAVARIVLAAVAVADAEGLEAVTMRRVATELGVAPMSLYRHVAGKDDLVGRMLDVVVAGVRVPGPDAGARGVLEGAARSLWAAGRRHPWLAPAMSVTRPQVLPRGMAFTERVLAGLTACGISLADAFVLYLTMIHFVRGVGVSVGEEAEAEAATGLTAEQWVDALGPDFAAAMASGRYPLLAAAAGQGVDADVDTLFGLGLTALLDGFGARLSSAGTRTPAPGRPSRR